MEGAFCRRNTGRGWSGDSDSSYRLPTRWAVPAGLPQGTHGSGQSTATVAPLCHQREDRPIPTSDTNIREDRYQQGTAPLLPALSQVADMRPFRTDWPEGFYGDACVPRQTAVPALDADLHRAAEPSLPNPSHSHQTTTKISDSFTEQSHYNLQVIMAIELRDNSCALSCNLFLPSP